MKRNNLIWIIAGFGVLLALQLSRHSSKTKDEGDATSLPLFSDKNSSSQMSEARSEAEVALKTSESQVRLQQIAKVAQEEFVKDLKALKTQLPTFENMRKKTAAELHDTPQEVLEAGALLGALKERWQKTPHLKPMAFVFYQDCMNDISLEVSVRSLCLSNARELARELAREKTLKQSPGAQEGLDESRVPIQVKKIADQLSI